jgi:hypothetical protein
MAVAEVDAMLTGSVAPERDRYGRYVIVDASTGKKVSFTRATTMASTLADKFGLQMWAQRMTALGLTKRHDLYARVAACRPDDNTELNRLVDEAKEAAAASAGANLGTALHSFTERMDRGEDIAAPEPWNHDLAAYRATLDAAGITVVPGMVEQIVVVPDAGVAGTFDRLMHAPGWTKPRVADLKTGKFLDWTEISVQLALYAHGDTLYDPATCTHSPMPDVDDQLALVIHLPAGQATCTLYEVDIAAGWEAVEIAKWVRGWRKRKDLAVTVTSKTAPTLTVVDSDGGLRAEHARQRLKVLIDRSAPLAWPSGVPTFRAARETGHTHTVAELDQIEAALSHAEATAEIPFTPDEPVASDDACAAMIARLEALPADLRAVVEAEARKQLVPNLRSGRALIRHLDSLDQVVTRLEAGAAQRGTEISVLLGDYADDPDLAVALAALAGTTMAGPLTDDARRNLTALVAALDAGLLAVAYTNTGAATLVGTDRAETLLAGCANGRAAALAAVKVVADTFGLPRPRTLAVAATDPLLVALVATTRAPDPQPPNQPGETP